MTKEDVLIQIQDIFKLVLKKVDVALTEHSTFGDVAGWDSLNHMIIMSEIEKHFKIKFNFREVLKLKNIGDVCNAVLAKIE